MNFPVGSILLTSILGAGALPACAADVVLAKSTFTHDLNGWTSNTPAEVVWQASGGNPAGVAVFSDKSGAGTYLDAPAAFLSPAINYSKLSNRAYISWQHKIGVEGQATNVGPYEIRLSGPGGAAKYDGTTPLATEHAYYTVVAPLNPADWTVTSGSWGGLLANVTDMQINIELVTNSNVGEDTEYLDNIEIVSHPFGFSPGAQ